MTPVPQSGSRLRPVGSAEGPSPFDLRRRWHFFLLFVPFLASLFGAYAWFNIDNGRSDSQPSTNNSRPRLWLEARTNIEGYAFVEQPVSDEVKKSLGTSNILSGAFYQMEDASQGSRDNGHTKRIGNQMDARDGVQLPPSALGPPTFENTLDRGRSTPDGPSTPSAQRITVFLASWSSESKKPISVLDHTPDICWTGAGWKPVELTGPHQLVIHLALNSSSLGHESEIEKSKFDVNLFFEYGLFEWPGKRSMELAAWCRWIPGERDENPSKPANESSWTNGASHRMRYLRRFWRRIESRTPVGGAKQFIRLSLPVSEDQDGAFKKIETFAGKWLRSISHQQPAESRNGNVGI